MTWDTRRCINGHLGTAKRCHCGQDTKPWSGESNALSITDFDKFVDSLLVEEMLKAEKDRPKE